MTGDELWIWGIYICTHVWCLFMSAPLLRVGICPWSAGVFVQDCCSGSLGGLVISVFSLPSSIITHLGLHCSRDVQWCLVGKWLWSHKAKSHTLTCDVCIWRNGISKDPVWEHGFTLLYWCSLCSEHTWSSGLSVLWETCSCLPPMWISDQKWSYQAWTPPCLWLSTEVVASHF